MSTVWILPRESVEWIGPVTLVGDQGTLEFALIPEGTRPAAGDWTASYVLGGAAGHLYNGDLTPGRYRLWARISDSPETPVYDNVAEVIIT